MQMPASQGLDRLADAESAFISALEIEPSSKEAEARLAEVRRRIDQQI